MNNRLRILKQAIAEARTVAADEFHIGTTGHVDNRVVLELTKILIDIHKSEAILQLRESIERTDNRPYVGNISSSISASNEHLERIVNELNWIREKMPDY